MTNRELVEILMVFEPEEEVTICFHNGEGLEVAGVDEVRDNNGPSIYAAGSRGER